MLGPGFVIIALNVLFTLLANEKRASCFNINHIHDFYINKPRHKNTCLGGGGGREGCEQYRRSLISAFVICLLENIISRLAKSKISIFLLVAVAEKTGLKLALSETL